MVYGVSFFSLSKIKIGVFLALTIAYFGNELIFIKVHESITTRPLIEAVLSIVFFMIIFYAIAAFAEFIFYKGRKKWPRLF